MALHACAGAGARTGAHNVGVPALGPGDAGRVPVQEQARDLVQRVEHQRVPAHGVHASL